MQIMNPISQRFPRFMPFFVTALVVLFLAGALVYRKAASVPLFLLAITGIVLLMRRGLPRDLARAEKWLLGAFALYFAIGVISYTFGIQTRLGWEILFRDIRFAFAIPAYLALRHYPPSLPLAALALALGGLLAGGDALWGYLAARQPGWRAEGDTISIVFGHLCVPAAGALLWFALAERLAGWQRLVCAAGFAAATLAVVLSGTRGAWLAWLAVVGAALAWYCWWAAWRERALVAGAVALLGALVLLFAWQPVERRITLATKDLRYYWQTEQALAAHDAELLKTGCIGSRAILEQLKAHVLPRGKARVETGVVKAADFPASEDCAATHALRFANLSERHSAWVYLPLRSVVKQESDVMKFWLRGRGALERAGDRESRRSFEASGWVEVEVKAEPSASPRPVVVLTAGQALELVPVALSPGEYRYFHTFASFSARIAMWSTAWALFRESPWLGAGTGAWPAATAERVRAGLSSGVVQLYDHAHNEALTLLADRGLAGLLSLLLLYGAPAALFLGALRRAGNARPHPAAPAGLLLVGGFAVSGLTETLFNHSLVITYYALLVSVFSVSLRGATAREAQVPAQ